MPKPRKKVRGLWEREQGSEIWWIRYRVDGVLKREKVGTHEAAKNLLNKRRNEIREGIKMPENMRQASLRFKTLCDDILVFSKKHHRDFRSVEIRVRKIVADFGETPVDKIKPADIDAWLSRVTKTPATSNRYRALFSLIFREAVRNGKIASNPARLVRQRAENNSRIRFLTEAEETSLRDAIRDRFPEHEAELTLSLGTGMRLAYVSLSRAQYDAQIYTNDAATLGQELSRDVSKSVALEGVNIARSLDPQPVQQIVEQIGLGLSL